MIRQPPRPTLFPSTTLFRSDVLLGDVALHRLDAHYASSRIVTGPSLTSSTAMSAPNTPVATVSPRDRRAATTASTRSEEHTSELQSRQYLVCRLLLEKKKIQ